MSSIGQDMPAIRRIPDLHRVIPGGRGDALAIARPRHRSHTIFMPTIGENMPAIGRIPDPHCVIIGTRGNPRAVGRPHYRSHWLCVSAINNISEGERGRASVRDKGTGRGSVEPPDSPSYHGGGHCAEADQHAAPAGTASRGGKLEMEALAIH